MLLREAVLSDLPAMIDVQRTGAVHGLAHIFPQHLYPFPRDEICSRWAQEVANPDVTVYVIEDDEGRIAGFAATRGDEVLHFGTAVHTWGAGPAAAAHNQILDRLTATGAAHARLRVFEDNRRACRFYEKLGWRPTGRRTQTSFPPHPVLVEYEHDL